MFHRLTNCGFWGQSTAADAARSMRYPGFAAIEYEQFSAAHSDPFRSNAIRQRLRIFLSVESSEFASLRWCQVTSGMCVALPSAS